MLTFWWRASVLGNGMVIRGSGGWKGKIDFVGRGCSGSGVR
jgi:hypothetical protein